MDSSTPKVTVTKAEEENDVISEPVQRNGNENEEIPTCDNGKNEEEKSEDDPNNAQKTIKCYCKGRRWRRDSSDPPFTFCLFMLWMLFFL